MSADADITARAVGVNVGAIEKELAALWRQASRDKQVTRACSWNLVVLAPDDAAYAHARPILDDAVRHVPSRALVLKPRPFTPGANGHEIEAWVSANCQVAPGGGKLLCTEEITIEARGDEGAAHLPGLMRALNVPDVPTALWWTGSPPTDANAVRLLAAGVDRLLYDSGDLDGDAALRGGLRRLAHVAGLLDSVALADLAWLRTGSLRAALASVFDAEGPAPLYALEGVRVQCAAGSVSSARLLVGWLASRLAWGPPERAARDALSWRARGRDAELRIDIEVVAAPVARASGVSALELSTRAGARFSLTAEDASRLSWQAPSRAPRTIVAHEPEPAQLVVAALGARGRDRLYPLALHRAVELDG